MLIANQKGLLGGLDLGMNKACGHGVVQAPRTLLCKTVHDAKNSERDQALRGRGHVPEPTQCGLNRERIDQSGLVTLQVIQANGAAQSLEVCGIVSRETTTIEVIAALLCNGTKRLCEAGLLEERILFGDHSIHQKSLCKTRHRREFVELCHHTLVLSVGDGHTMIGIPDRIFE